MIYLIDDNVGDKRRKLFGIDFVDGGAFDNCLVSIEKIKSGEDISFLEKADCVLIHKTTQDVNDSGLFIAGSNYNANKIIDIICDYGSKIPVAIFSNSMSEDAVFDYEKNPNCISAIKKNVFYNNLRDFLEDFSENKSIDFRVLAYGKNYEFVDLGKCAQKLVADLSTYPLNASFDISFLRELSVLENFFKMSKFYSSYDDFLIYLEDNDVSVGCFVENISLILESVNKYGKNIHNWKCY